jgi:hypothetical protein
MSLESAVYLNTLDPTLPTGADSRAEGDDHLRQLKRVLQSTFPYIAGPVLVAQTELNYLSGLSSNLVTQLAAKAPLTSPNFSGTPTAPTAPATTNSTQVATTAFVQVQKDSPTFTGTPSAPTPETSSNSTRLATTEFVQNVVAASGTVDNTSRAVMFYFGSF